jgi:hypothetical protein
MKKNAERVLLITIKERVILPGILPAQGDKLTMIMCRSLIQKAEFTTQEIKKFEMTATGEAVTWGKAGNEASFTIDISDAEAMILKDAAKELDSSKRITQHNLSLIEKIEAL